MEGEQENAIVNEVVQNITSGKAKDTQKFDCSKVTKKFVGREKPSVPINHWGPVPDVPVGTCWKYRFQVRVW